MSDILTSVSRETRLRLEHYVSMVLKWNSHINLIAPSTTDEIWNRHVVDSLQLIDLAPSSTTWVDLGSGGGFPGMVIAIMLDQATGSRVELVESNSKKAAFLSTVRNSCAPNCIVHPDRIENVVQRIAKPEVVTARALAPLGKLLALTEPWLAAGSIGLFPKGRDHDHEVRDTSSRWSYDLVTHRSKTDVDARILEIRNLRRLG